MEETTFNQQEYIKRQKIMMRSLTNKPNREISLLGKVIMCYRDKPEWIIVCNANKWAT